MVDKQIDTSMRQWREMFAASMESELRHLRELLEEVRSLVREQNSSVQANALEIAGLKTWVKVVGGLIGVAGVGVAIFQMLR